MKYDTIEETDEEQRERHFLQGQGMALTGQCHQETNYTYGLFGNLLKTKTSFTPEGFTRILRFLTREQLDVWIKLNEASPLAEGIMKFSRESSSCLVQ